MGSKYEHRTTQCTIDGDEDVPDPYTPDAEHPTEWRLVGVTTYETRYHRYVVWSWEREEPTNA